MKTLEIQTQERTEFVDITARVQAVVMELGMKAGAVTVFVPYTTAGITINENADPDVLADIKAELEKIIPWNGHYRHSEGNSTAHIKAGLIDNVYRIIRWNMRLGALKA